MLHILIFFWNNSFRTTAPFAFIKSTRKTFVFYIRILTYHLLNYIQNSKCLNYCTILEMMIKEIKGVYCIALLNNKGSIYICRDSYGVRPYVIGIKDNNICVASESSCFPEGFTYSREVVNGEIN